MSLNFLKGIGNQYVELSRLLWAASVVAGIAYAGFHLFRDGAFNIIEFGTGMGLLLAGGGAATAIKDTAVAKATVTAAQASSE
jgi:hypothetical protein